MELGSELKPNCRAWMSHYLNLYNHLVKICILQGRIAEWNRDREETAYSSSTVAIFQRISHLVLLSTPMLPQTVVPAEEAMLRSHHCCSSEHAPRLYNVTGVQEEALNYHSGLNDLFLEKWNFSFILTLSLSHFWLIKLLVIIEDKHKYSGDLFGSEQTTVCHALTVVCFS